MQLKPLFHALAEAFDGPEAIERVGRDALLSAPTEAVLEPNAPPLPPPVLSVMSEPDAHPVCKLIAQTPLSWAPPQTSNDPDYIAHSAPKLHVELLGPDGLVASDSVRLGVYGILPGAEYGIRTHPAEEIFVMLAGSALWKRGDRPYQALGPGERSYHPPMMPHATKTEALAFMSLYIWYGDISTENYVYKGIPAA